MNAPLSYERIGLKTKFYSSYDGDFDSLLELFRKNIFQLSQKSIEIMDGEIIDIGCALNLKDKFGNFNTNAGPMQSAQANTFLERNITLPPVGIYFEIDYWQKPNDKMGNESLIKILSTYTNRSWEKYKNLVQLVLGE